MAAQPSNYPPPDLLRRIVQAWEDSAIEARLSLDEVQEAARRAAEVVANWHDEEVQRHRAAWPPQHFGQAYTDDPSGPEIGTLVPESPAS